MIVSKDLGFFVLNRPNSKKEKMIAPQRQVGTIESVFGDSHTDLPYSTPHIHAGIPHCPELRSFTRRPQNKAVNSSRPEGMFNNVPLKCDQEFSHAEGSSVFNAPAVPFMRRLPIREDKPREIFVSHYTEEHDVPFEIPLDYERGIRPGMRLLPTMKHIPEPVGETYRSRGPRRPDDAGVHIKATDYNLGDAELKLMMKYEL
jgi:hypothetical protein